MNFMDWMGARCGERRAHQRVVLHHCNGSSRSAEGWARTTRLPKDVPPLDTINSVLFPRVYYV